ncbi:MAG: glycosyltransferase family 4 protein [Patescibacteria group bacterium]
MKSLLFTLEYPPFKGGVANYYQNLVQYWAEPGNIFVLDNNKNKLIKSWLWPKWLLAGWQLVKEIRQKKINYIIVGQILPLGTVTYLVSRFIKVRYAVFFHGMDFNLAIKVRRKRWVTKKILINSDKIICANSYVAELVLNFLGGKYTKKVKIVNPGVESRERIKNKEQKLKIKKEYNLEKKVILFSLGRLVKRKGFDMVIKALPEVLKVVPNLVYIIAGDGPDRAYLEQLAKVDNNKKLPVIFIGGVSDEDKWSWLGLCDIFIMPARQEDHDFEGFGIVYLEANLAGKPVIAGNSGGVKDAVQDGANGLLVDGENEEEITQAIIRLAEDKNLRQVLGEKGRKRAISEFSWEKQAKKMYNIIFNA